MKLNKCKIEKVLDFILMALITILLVISVHEYFFKKEMSRTEFEIRILLSLVVMMFDYLKSEIKKLGGQNENSNKSK